MILVTGGTGFVGSHLLFDLAKSGEKVRAIHRKNSDLEAVKKVFSYYTDEKNAE
ncbi:MAG: NAD-dependent epimerase/dehydratase family protein, partial [Salegentibacter sp.]